MPDGLASDPAVAIAARGPLGMVTLRGALASPALADAVRAATGCPVPERRRIVFAGENAAAWMSPDELMLFVAPGSPTSVVADLSRALAGEHHLAADVSDARALFRLTGPGARAVLAKGAPVDLTPTAFGPGDFRRTRLGQVAAAFWMPEADTFDLTCFRSVGGFVAEWLATAARPGSLAGLA
jgi:sarcosine oxidase subunit gamma